MGYVVTWSIDLDADTPVDAARQAFALMQEPGCTCNYFEVFDADTQQIHGIDLETIDEE